jgi:hypothetical protein
MFACNDFFLFGLMAPQLGTVTSALSYHHAQKILKYWEYFIFPAVFCSRVQSMFFSLWETNLSILGEKYKMNNKIESNNKFMK